MNNVNALVRALTLGMKHQEATTQNIIEIEQLSLEFVEANKGVEIPKEMLLSITGELFILKMNDEGKIETMMPIEAKTISLISIEECQGGYKAIGKGQFPATDLKVEKATDPDTPNDGATANDGEDDTHKEENTATDLENGVKDDGLSSDNAGNKGGDALDIIVEETTTST